MKESHSPEIWISRRSQQMVKTRIEIFPDIMALIDFFEAVPEYDVAMYTHKKMKTTAESSLKVLKEIAAGPGSSGRLQQRCSV